MRLPPHAFVAMALAGLAFGLALSDSVFDWPYTGSGLLDLFVGWSFIGVGLYAWWRRPSNPMGLLMTATGFLWFISLLTTTGDPAVFALASVIGASYHATTLHLLLAFPTGRLPTPTARVAALAGYALFIGGNLLVWLVTDIRATFDCPGCPPNVLQVVHNETLADAVRGVADALAAGLAAYALLRILVGWSQSRGWRRRALTPTLFAGAATAFVLSVALLTLAVAPPVAEDLFFWAGIAFATVPYAFLLGLARSAVLGGGAVGELVARLTEAGGCDEARAALRDALGDPSLELGFRVEDGDEYMGPDGKPMDLPGPGAARACAPVALNRRIVAMIVYDGVVVDDPNLVEAVTTAAALAIEKHQLDAELRVRLEELRASRERIVEAGYDERRRLERNLHDGAQQRLVSLALELRLAQGKLQSDPAAARELLESVGEELDAALGELRELARGIHPAVLSDRGLDAALHSLASRSPFDVRVESAQDGRLPERVESAAYFVVSEALTNATKHAEASQAVVSVTRDNGRVTIEVSDDGIGGADPAAGSGLRGLLDRVAALDGGFEIDSRPGRGTTVRASIPCA